MDIDRFPPPGCFTIDVIVFPKQDIQICILFP